MECVNFFNYKLLQFIAQAATENPSAFRMESWVSYREPVSAAGDALMMPKIFEVSLPQPQPECPPELNFVNSHHGITSLQPLSLKI